MALPEIGDIPIGYSQSRGWIVDVAGDARLMRSEEIDEYKLEDIVYFPARMRAMLGDLHVEGTRSINGRETYVVSGNTRVLPVVQLYFDKDSGLLVRVMHQIDSVVGRYPTEVDFADYRTQAGAMIPFRWTLYQVKVEGGPIVYRVDHVEENVPIDDSRFRKPGER